MVVGGGGEEPVEPGLEPRDVGLPGCKDAGGHQQVAEEVQGLGLGQPVQRVVADRHLTGGHGGEDPRAGAGAQPVERGAWLGDLDQRAVQRAQDRADGAVGAGQQGGDLLVEQAAWA